MCAKYIWHHPFIHSFIRWRREPWKRVSVSFHNEAFLMCVPLFTFLYHTYKRGINKTPNYSPRTPKLVPSINISLFKDAFLTFVFSHLTFFLFDVHIDLLTKNPNETGSLTQKKALFIGSSTRNRSRRRRGVAFRGPELPEWPSFGGSGRRRCRSRSGRPLKSPLKQSGLPLFLP